MGKQRKGEKFKLPKANPRLEKCPRCGGKFRHASWHMDIDTCSKCGKRITQPSLSRVPPNWSKNRQPEWACQFTSKAWKRLRENRGR